jgi:salicylate hydroxylase
VARLDIVIVGAGIGGLTAALALQRRGHRVRLREQAAELGEVGAGVMMSPNATRVLIALGLGAGLAADGLTPRYTAVRDSRDGRELSRTEVGDAVAKRHGAPFYYIHRADLHRLLATAVLAGDPGCIALNAPVRDDAMPEADLVIGADGLKSRVRAHVAGNVPTLFTGNVAWRGLVPMERLRPEIRQPESIVWVGPGRHVVRYGVRGGTLMNYVALTERSAWQDEGWTVRSDVADVLKEFEGWHPDVVDIIRATPPDQCFKWGLFDRDPLPRWVKGRTVLLGDAAHPMLPFMAQGAAMAIEDGAVLATMLDKHADVDAALAAYERERLPRTAWVQQQSRANQHLYHGGKDGAAFDADRAVRASRLYDYDAFAA